jgi:hypothetical protein
MDTRHEEPRNLADELLLDSFAAVRATMLRAGAWPAVVRKPRRACAAARAPRAEAAPRGPLRTFNSSRNQSDTARREHGQRRAGAVGL